MMHIVVVVTLAAAVLSCGVKGTFGFKKFGQDSYHRLDGVPEFSSDETVDWAFVFDKRYRERTIGIVYQKKELVWIEMLSKTGRIGEDGRAVYGSIDNLPPGTYQIVLTDLNNGNTLIDSKDFIVYEKDDEEEE